MGYVDTYDCYEMGKLIGSGGFGEVYSGYERSTGDEVAIKFSRDHEANEYVVREWEVLSKTVHSNIVRGMDFGYDKEGVPFIVMELLPTALKDINHKKLSYEQWLELGYQLGLGVVELWNQGWLHNDLYARNVMLDNGIVKLCDFGEATSIKDASKWRKKEETRDYLRLMLGYFPITYGNYQLEQEHRTISGQEWYEPIELLEFFDYRRNMEKTDGQSLQRLG